MGSVRDGFVLADQEDCKAAADRAEREVAEKAERAVRLNKLLSTVVEDKELLQKHNVQIVDPETGLNMGNFLGHEPGFAVWLRGELIANAGFDRERSAYFIIETDGDDWEIFTKPDQWKWFPDHIGCAQGLGQLIFRYTGSG